MVLIAEEVGYAAAPEPIVETTCVVVPILMRYAAPELRNEWLPRIAAGEVIATVQLDGMPAASFGQFADAAIVGGQDGLRLADLSEVDRVAAPSEDFARHPGAIRSAGQSLSGGSQALLEAKVRGATFAAAVLNGVSQRLLDMSVQHALDREQFGVPIGSFQAVKHMLAEVYVQLESSRSAAWFAARALAQNDENKRISASVAKLTANCAAKLANWNALQVHGGVGFTWEHNLHVWMKRGRALEEQWGSSREHRRLLGDAVMESDDLIREFGPTLGEAP